MVALAADAAAAEEAVAAVAATAVDAAVVVAVETVISFTNKLKKGELHLSASPLLHFCLRARLYELDVWLLRDDSRAISHIEQA